MKQNTLLTIIAAVLCLALNLSSIAQTTPGSILYNPNVNLSTTEHIRRDCRRNFSDHV